MKKIFMQRILVSIILIIIGGIEMMFDKSGEFDFGYLNIFIGGIILIISMISYIKYQNNSKEIDKELSKEYDERDDLIDGKVAKFSLSILIGLILIIMFITNWVSVPTDKALAILLVALIITETLSRKYYNHIL